MRLSKRAIAAGVFVTLVIGLSMMMTANAGDVVLSNNSGTGSSTWFISGEASLVMNGFDLSARGITLPTRLDRVSIDVASPRAGVPVDIVIYQDANGGSPLDATVVRRIQVDITTSGVFTYTFPDPPTITQPVIWVGFYLPVDFQFRADTSGTSVLTYWAWQPNARFDLNNLTSAGVIGPADGSAPVNINLGGVARISAELVTGAATTPVPTVVGPAPTNAIRQVLGDSNVSLVPMVAYPNCLTVFYDSQDVAVTYRSGVRWFCRVVNTSLSPATPQGYTFRGLLYDVFVFGVDSGANRLPYPVTHCIRPDPADLNTAVLGLASGAPRRWAILPTVRYGDLICAELNYAGNIAYFLPNF